MRYTPVVLTAAALLLTGCGTTRGDGAGAGGGAGATSTQVDTIGSELTVTVHASEQAAAQKWTLRCDPPGGDHPDAKAACTALAAAKKPFEPTAKDQMCTQIYGGPQTATIVGRWQGEEVNATYKRTNGCEIARWKQLATVLQTNTGVVPD